ncbi:MAG TPA: isocitrate/isopropylmalate dehydrogenase family protein [Firmicutes bacterium]|nr:isocitrate/isopropylmalate dehydrogenase family protein [Bacillota bacterium]
MTENVRIATEKFAALLEKQLARVERMKADNEMIDYTKLDKLIIGIVGGDGIGPIITAEAQRILETLLADKIRAGKVELRMIEGLTIENRLAQNKAIPDDIMEQLKACHVILKGPTTTPDAGDGCKNLESANVAMRKGLDLFANVRPVKVPEQGIDWCFFRENSEGIYAVGTEGVNVTEDLGVDFTIETTQATERIARMAYDYARKNGKTRVSIITKANVVKTTDGNFLNICKRIGQEYPEITTDDWYADILTAKLIDPKRRTQFQVLILPNLYGDIITDEAAEFQGGVGTAGGANLGNRYAMFEAIHGSAPRMVEEGRGQYADPCSLLRAAVMMLNHVSFFEEAAKLEKALDYCMFQDKKLVITGREGGATCREFGDYIMASLDR